MKQIKITLLSCLALAMSCQENSEEVLPTIDEVVLEKNEELDALAQKLPICSLHR
ncbi:MAG: hypothetical protein GY816_22445 [Cytophagales bacterium]|nr:hypothetical protein [Cytophagales bacterium]